jgi:hypothetical protein
VPAAIKLQEEYGDAIQVVLVHSQKATPEQAVNFALKAKWLGNQAIWTSDYLFSSGGNGLPAFALLDAEGKVVLKGNSNSLKGKIEDELERMLKEASGAPEGTPKAVAKAYAEMAKGNLAKAVAAAEKAKAKPGSKEPDAVIEAAEAALIAVQANLDSQLARSTWMLENGYPLDAEAKLKTLGKSVKGHEAMTAKVLELQGKLEAEEMKEILKAAKDLAKIEAKLYDSPKDEKAQKKLAEFASENAGNPVGKRASKLVEVASVVSR